MPGTLLIPLREFVAGTNLTQSIIQVGKKYFHYFL